MHRSFCVREDQHNNAHEEQDDERQNRLAIGACRAHDQAENKRPDP